MYNDQRGGILQRSISVAILTSALAAGTTSVAGTTVLFEQPLETGIASHLFVAHVTNAGMPKATFDLVVERPNPQTASGYLVPTSWDAGSQTGFGPASPSTAQLGFRNQVGTSTAQMEGDTVGAYLNSRDMPTTQNYQKMMITPQYTFPSGAAPVVFGSSSSTLNGELDLQVPVAVGSSTYVTADFLFVGADGLRVTFDVKIFRNGAINGSLFNAAYDAPADVYMVNCPLGNDTEYVTKAPASNSTMGTPWLGWRHFQWTIDQAQFTAALKQLAKQYPAKVRSTDPTLYVLTAVHLNAEFHYSPSPAELGWSMRGLKVWSGG